MCMACFKYNLFDKIDFSTCFVCCLSVLTQPYIASCFIQGGNGKDTTKTNIALTKDTSHIVLMGEKQVRCEYMCFMMTSSNGNIFRVTGPLCGEFTGHRWNFDAKLWCFFDLRLNKRLSKQLWGWWFETQSRSLWRHCNVGTLTWIHHGMETLSVLLALFEGKSPVNSPHKGQWCWDFMFYLLLMWTSCWAKSRVAGGLS